MTGLDLVDLELCLGKILGMFLGHCSQVMSEPSLLVLVLNELVEQASDRTDELPEL